MNSSDSVNLQDEQFDSAMQEIAKGDYVHARRILEALPKHRYAQLYLAALYRDGQGGPIETEKARSIFQLFAESGDVDAMYMLARLYLSEHKLSDAAQYFEHAARLDHPSAAYWAAALYEGHAGHPVDETKYDFFLRRVADLDHLFAIRDIARNEMRRRDSLKSWIRGFFQCQHVKLRGLFIAIRNPDDLRIR